jgi:hypothetical protein
VADSPFIDEEGTSLGTVAWKSIFAAAELLQSACPKCEDAVSLMVFAKDLVNVKKGVALYDAENYKKWLNLANSVEMKFQESLTITNAVTHILKAMEMLDDIKKNLYAAGYPQYAQRLELVTTELEAGQEMALDTQQMVQKDNIRVDLRETEHV